MKELIEKMSYDEISTLKTLVDKRYNELDYLDKQNIKPFEDYADVFTLKEFKEMEEYGHIMDCDGSAYYATENGRSRVEYFMNHKPKWATHVAFYGK